LINIQASNDLETLPGFSMVQILIHFYLYISGFQDNPLSTSFSYAAWVKITKLERGQLQIEA
jgi:hypothetical protein